MFPASLATSLVPKVCRKWCSSSNFEDYSFDFGDRSESLMQALGQLLDGILHTAHSQQSRWDPFLLAMLPFASDVRDIAISCSVARAVLRSGSLVITAPPPWHSRWRRSRSAVDLGMRLLTLKNANVCLLPSQSGWHVRQHT